MRYTITTASEWDGSLSEQLPRLSWEGYYTNKQITIHADVSTVLPFILPRINIKIKKCSS
ncbi:MAG: hypothetical protein P0116_04580 [Candidatus Nitrosocosmicus sp.]|nr:hypothetical protein [Candidatus Nitrosocosmicus sp.]